MKIATWNVNSIRIRLPIITNWLIANPVDVLCLQETKVIDESFPQEIFTELGYHLSFSGQKAYNGVAIVSREPLTDMAIGFGGILGSDLVGDFDEQKRVIAGIYQGVRIVNLYVPNGSALDSEKYQYKLKWLFLLQQYLTKLITDDVESNICVCGDFNIALDDRDIYTPKKNHLMASIPEREALIQAVLNQGFQDVFRKFTSDDGHFSWWDYRQQGFTRNRGWRIDHIYLSPVLYDRALDCTIDIEPRKLEQPSDHTPVILTL